MKISMLFGTTVVGAFFLFVVWLLVAGQADHARSVEGALHFKNKLERCKHFDGFETIQTQDCGDLVKLGVIRLTP